MELRANIANEYSFYNTIYNSSQQNDIDYFYPSEAEILNIYNNLEYRKILREKLSLELKDSLLYQMLHHEYETLDTPSWQQKILNYLQPLKPSHSESDNWILNLNLNLRILKRIKQLQKHVRDLITSVSQTDVLCLGASAVVGMPELHAESGRLSICCIEPDERLLSDLAAAYHKDQGIRKIVCGNYQHYFPDRKYDVIIYPSGRTWQETEKMQDLLLKLRSYLKPEKGRFLAY